MIQIEEFTNRLKCFIITQINTMSKDNPIISFLKPLITRALDKNLSKITEVMDLIADKDGNIDIENILSEMMENVMNTTPFVLKTSFIGDITIGGSKISFNLPLTNKQLLLDIKDLKYFKESLINGD